MEYTAKLDRVFSEYIRLRDANEDGIIHCPLCGVAVYWRSAENMHFVKRENMMLRYSEVNCNAGCLGCNHSKDGRHAVYAVWIDNKFGPGTSEDLEFKGRMTMKYTNYELKEKISYYQGEVKKLKKIKNCERLF